MEPKSENSDETKPARGFARLTPEQRRALGSKGGKTAHQRGNANKFTSETGSRAGRIAHERGTAYRWTADEAREAGRKGGRAVRITRSQRVPVARASEPPMDVEVDEPRTPRASAG